jgi:microcystin-dependent protein
MAQSYLGQILLVSYNFAPKGWAFCQGQLLPISQNTALFSLLGTNFGGDGDQTFGLPNLQGCVPIHWGQGTGLSSYFIGDTGGEISTTLLSSEMPAHTHTPPTALANTARGTLSAPASSATIGATGRGVQPVYLASGSVVPMSYAGFSTAGSSFPHNNMMQSLVVNYIISLQGAFPPRS